MDRQLFKDGLGWGFGLWLMGYGLGIILFMLVPQAMIGWLIMPIGTVAALWVLFKKVKGNSLQYFTKIAIIWVVVAVLLDYVFIVKMLEPEDGYYKLDVYFYYLLTLALPLMVGWYKSTDKNIR